MQKNVILSIAKNLLKSKKGDSLRMFRMTLPHRRLCTFCKYNGYFKNWFKISRKKCVGSAKWV